MYASILKLVQKCWELVLMNNNNILIPCRTVDNIEEDVVVIEVW
jgi:hypothetical protein